MIQITRSADVLKLIDFGAARYYGEESLTGQLEPCIDYQYLAPEVFKQESIGPGTDVWGVGVIIYIMWVHYCIIIALHYIVPCQNTVLYSV